MGIVYTATCPTCNYKKEFHLGFGLRSIDLLFSAQALSEKEQMDIQKMNDNREISNFLVENKLTECLHCNMPEKLKDKTIITITKPNHHNLVFGNKCSNCRKELQIYDSKKDKGIDKVSCPCCKDSFLTFKETGLWD